MSDQEFARQQMIEQQLRAWSVFDPRVLCAFDEVRREEFVPASYRSIAFADTEIPLGHGERMMAPKVEGRLLDALAIRPTDRILEVGTGSGWVTAVLGTLGAEVLSFDIVPEFTASARQKLQSAGITNATVETRDAAELDGSESAFDVIALTGSLPLYDARFERMLNPEGRLFVVCGESPVMSARLVMRDAGDGFSSRDLFETDLGALRNFRRPTRFAL